VLQVNVIDTPDALLSVSSLDVVTGSTATYTPAIEKTLVITNKGPLAAQNITAGFDTAAPAGTTVLDNCSSGSLAVNAQCTVTITPGTDASGAPYAIPEPTSLTVEGSNTNKIKAEVTVLGFASIYQGGYVFAVQPGTNQSTVAGTVVSLADNSTGANVQWGPMGTFTQANSNSDGQANTVAANAKNGEGHYAPYLCNQVKVNETGSACTRGNACFDNWYLPAICEMGGDGTVLSCTPAMPNIAENLDGLYASNCSLGAQQCLTNKYYFSSTQFQGNPYDSAIAAHYVPGQYAGQGQALIDKNVPLHLRCVRQFS
jgi:hypothetical protein